MENTLNYNQDLETMALRVGDLFLQYLERSEAILEKANVERLMEASRVEWHALSAFYCKLATLEYAHFVLSLRTSHFENCMPTSLFRGIRSFLERNPTPLSSNTLEPVARVVDTARCILTLLYHAAPYTRDIWTEHLVFLDGFWLVYTQYTACRSTHLLGQVQSSANRDIGRLPQCSGKWHRSYLFLQAPGKGQLRGCQVNTQTTNNPLGRSTNRPSYVEHHG